LSVDEIHQNNNQVANYRTHDVSEPQLVSAGINLEFFIDFARRRFRVILLAILFMCGVGFIYFMVVPASYTGVAVLKIDTRKFQLFKEPTSLGDQSFDSSPEVESQLEVLKSENLALKVIDKLHLADDPEFGKASAIPIVSNLLETQRPESESWRTRNALQILDKHLTVSRRGFSYMIDISFESANPERAAQIANAIAEAYIADQVDAKYQITREGSKWLEGRIKEVRDQVSAAEKAVIDYKAMNKIVDAGNGRLMTEQQLTDLNSQLTIARAKTSEMRARLDRINAALNDSADMTLVNATAGEGLSDQLITKLRTQYLELAAREAELSEKYGRNHLAAVNVRNDMRRIRDSILAELQRLQEAYKSDYEVASEAEKLVEKQLQQAVAQSQTSKKAQVNLRDLETSAQTYKTLYDNFLKRYTEAVEQQSFPYTDAELITKATPPIRAAHRKRLLIVAMTPLMGLFFGIGLGALGDFLDRGFRTSIQIESILDLACIALIPLQKKPENKTENRRAPSITGPSARLISNEADIASIVVEQPFSRFAEAIRTIKLAADLNGVGATNRVVGLTSAMPNEGKSTIAAALAHSIAQAGGRVILVDCDLRNPSVSRALAPSASAGILEVLSGKVSLDEALCKGPFLNMAFLPVLSEVRIAHSSEVLTSSAMKKLFEKLRYSYDYVIVDLPPLAPLVDVRATTHFVDSYVLVVEWGRTYTAIVKHALTTAPHVYEKILGAVLNKVDMKALSLYDGNQGRYYHSKAYARYGYTD
jgi:polysaccharide biosynthesis transport protein